MVFVWKQTDGRRPYFTLSQVALNDLIMVFAFAPVVGLLLGVSSITVPWDTLLISVVLYIVIPVIMARLIRKALLRHGQTSFDEGDAQDPALVCGSAAADPGTAVCLPGQCHRLSNPGHCPAGRAHPDQVIFNASLAYWLNKKWEKSIRWPVRQPSWGASNFFELAVAAASSFVRFPLGRRIGNRGWGIDRGAYHAAGREGRECHRRGARRQERRKALTAYAIKGTI